MPNAESSRGFCRMNNQSSCPALLLIDSSAASPGKTGVACVSHSETEEGSDGFAIGGGDVSPGIWSIHGKVEKLYHGKIIFVNVYYVYASVVLGNRE